MSAEPQIGETAAPSSIPVEATTEGVIGRWLVGDGDRVEQNAELVEIETDKATVAYPAPAAGFLEIVALEGTTVAVGDVIAQLASERTPGNAEPRASAEASADREPIADAIQAEPAPSGAAAPEVRATPLARQLSQEHGVSLASIAGSGPRGRVTRGDVMSRLGTPAPTAPPVPPAFTGAPAAARPQAPREPGVDVRQELTRAQQTIARRMSESHVAVPSFQVETEVAMDRVLRLRQEFKELGDGSPIPSLNDFVIRASALALREHPLANGSYRDGTFVLLARVNVGVAVATDGSLLVPTVADADARSLFDIAAETSRLAERARAGTIAPTELADATFTVSNLGMFGMTAITPIVDVPQAAILGVGAVRETLALADGVVVTRRLLTLRLSCDHRILYGADAARFLSTIRDLLEQPLRLLR